MNFFNFQDILPHVEMPGRYIGVEANTVKKDHKKISCRIALAFPDIYEIGSSHMGIQVLYHIINKDSNALAERVFAPAVDMIQYLKQNNISLTSLETKTPLNQFDIIGFSLLYELNYTNILSILDLSGIPFKSVDRDNSFPFIIAGGPCTCNPEPVSDFFDAIVIGDGEQVIVKMIEKYKEFEKKDRSNILKAWSKIEGVYVPQFYDYQIFNEYTGKRIPLNDATDMVKRAIVPDLNEIDFPNKPVVAIGKTVHDRYSLEIARGCSRGCRFCQAGMIYRPVRERSIDRLLELATTSLKLTGHDEISLLSLSSGDYSQINTLMNNIMSYCQNDHVAVSLPSLRAGTLTPELMALIKKVRKTGFTIAPEAGSERLRNVINKNITEEDIINTVSQAFQMGWQLIKLYFMIGLPSETSDDIEEIIDLVKRLKAIIKTYSKRAHLNVSVSTFIPKPHTPFQWCKQISLNESKEKISYLKNKLSIKGVRFKWQDPKVSYMEGIWSRGDRRLGNVLVEAYNLGCLFDGWSDLFRFDLWNKAFDKTGINQETYHLSRSLNEPFPWDHIDTRINSSFLLKEWQKAQKEEKTLDCRTDACSYCGICDFKQIMPVSGKNVKERLDIKSSSIENIRYNKMIFSYTKQSYARFLGHLEMVTIIIRAFRRAGFNFQYSKGFHPMPKISFSDPLPLGVSSEEEFFVASIYNSDKPLSKIDNSCLLKINLEFPEGLKLLSCEKVTSKNPLVSKKLSCIKYEVQFADNIDMNKLEKFISAKNFIVIKERNKRKSIEVDLKKEVLEINMSGNKKMHLLVNNNNSITIRPKFIIQSILGLDDESIKAAYILKLASNRSI